MRYDNEDFEADEHIGDELEDIKRELAMLGIKRGVNAESVINVKRKFKNSGRQTHSKVQKMVSKCVSSLATKLENNKLRGRVKKLKKETPLMARNGISPKTPSDFACLVTVYYCSQCKVQLPYFGSTEKSHYNMEQHCIDYHMSSVPWNKRNTDTKASDVDNKRKGLPVIDSLLIESKQKRDQSRTSKKSANEFKDSTTLQNLEIRVRKEHSTSTAVKRSNQSTISAAAENVKIKEHKEYPALASAKCTNEFKNSAAIKDHTKLTTAANMTDDEESKHMAAINRLLIVLKQNRAENKEQLAAIRNKIEVSSGNAMTHKECISNPGVVYHEHMTQRKVIDSDSNSEVVCEETNKVGDDSKGVLKRNAAINVIEKKSRNCINDRQQYIDSCHDQKKRINDINLNDKTHTTQEKLSFLSTNSNEHATLKPSSVDVKIKLSADHCKSGENECQNDCCSTCKCEKLERGHCKDDRNMVSLKQIKDMKNMIDTNGSEKVVRTSAADNVLKETVDKDNFAIDVANKKKHDKTTNKKNQITVKSFSSKSKTDWKPAIRTDVNDQISCKQTDNGDNQSAVDSHSFNEKTHSGEQNIICCIEISSDENDDTDSIYKKQLSKKSQTAKKVVGNIYKPNQHNNTKKKGNEIHGASVSGLIERKNSTHKLIKGRVPCKSEINDEQLANYYSPISSDSGSDTINVCASNKLVPHNYNIGTDSQIHNNRDDQIQKRINNSGTIESKNKCKNSSIMKHTEVGDEIYSNQAGDIENKNIYYSPISSENEEINKTSTNNEVSSEDIGTDSTICNDQASSRRNSRIQNWLNDFKKSKDEKADKKVAASSASGTNKKSNIKVVDDDDQINHSGGTIKQKKLKPDNNKETIVNNLMTINQQISANFMGNKTSESKQMTVIEKKTNNKPKHDRKTSAGSIKINNLEEQIHIPDNKACVGENVQKEDINNLINKKETMKLVTDNKFRDKIRAKDVENDSEKSRNRKTDKGVATGSISGTDKKSNAKTVISDVLTNQLGEKLKLIFGNQMIDSAIQNIEGNSKEMTVTEKKIDHKVKSDRKSSASSTKSNNLMGEIQIPSNKGRADENVQTVEMNNSSNKKERTTPMTDYKFNSKIRIKDGENESKKSKNIKTDKEIVTDGISITDKKSNVKTLISDIQTNQLDEKLKPIFDNRMVASAIQNIADNLKGVTVIENEIDNKPKSNRRPNASCSKINNFIDQIQIPRKRTRSGENVQIEETNNLINKKETTTPITDNKLSEKNKTNGTSVNRTGTSGRICCVSNQVVPTDRIIPYSPFMDIESILDDRNFDAIANEVFSHINRLPEQPRFKLEKLSPKIIAKVESAAKKAINIIEQSLHEEKANKNAVNPSSRSSEL